MLLNDCASRTPSDAILALPGTHLLHRPIPPTHSPMQPHALPSIISVSFNGTVIPRLKKFHELAALQNLRVAVLENEARPGIPHPTNPRLRLSATRHSWQRHKTQQGRWFDGQYPIRRSVPRAILCHHQSDGTPRGHYPPRYYSITNVYLLPHRTDYSSNHQDDQ